MSIYSIGYVISIGFMFAYFLIKKGPGGVPLLSGKSIFIDSKI